MSEQEYLQIDEVASRTGLTKRTIRYYEEIGLLHPPTRTEGGYRLFTREDLDRLERIKRLRELMNFSLAEIKEHVEADELRKQLQVQVKQEVNDDSRLEKLRRLAEITAVQVNRIDDKIRQLGELRADYAARLQRSRQRLAEEQASRGRPAPPVPAEGLV
jgi:MerR family transcriptional regulator, repressor of the yfmOP operon